MAWVLSHTDVQNVYWRRTEDNHVVGFNRVGVGEPSSTETEPPADIDKYAPPLDESIGLQAEIAALKAKMLQVEVDVADLKKGK